MSSSGTLKTERGASCANWKNTLLKASEKWGLRQRASSWGEESHRTAHNSMVARKIYGVYTDTYIQMHKGLYKYTFTCTQRHIYMHTYAETCRHVLSDTHTHTHTHVLMLTQTHGEAHIHAHTRMHRSKMVRLWCKVWDQKKRWMRGVDQKAVGHFS
jgi:hypothetical protein